MHKDFKELFLNSLSHSKKQTLKQWGIGQTDCQDFYSNSMSTFKNSFLIPLSQHSCRREKWKSFHLVSTRE